MINITYGDSEITKTTFIIDPEELASGRMPLEDVTRAFDIIERISLLWMGRMFFRGELVVAVWPYTDEPTPGQPVTMHGRQIGVVLSYGTADDGDYIANMEIWDPAGIDAIKGSSNIRNLSAEEKANE